MSASVRSFPRRGVVALVFALVGALVPVAPAAAASVPPGGDGCADAAQVTGSGAAQGTTVGRADDHGAELGANVDGSGMPDVVWRFDVVEHTRVVIRSAGVEPWMGGLYLMYGPDHPRAGTDSTCSDAWLTISYRDNWFSSNGGASNGDYSMEIDKSLEPGPYYLWLDGDNSGRTAGAGAYEVSFDFIDAPPAGGGGSTPAPGPAPSGGDRRLADSADPVLAAASLSRGTFADQSARVAVIGRDDVFADSLAGAALAATDGPILYTSGGPDAPARPEMLDELRRVLPPATRCDGAADANVYLLGGEAAVSAAASQAIRAAGYCVLRFAGPSRVETAVMIAQFLAEVDGAPSQVLLARADNWADAATGGAYAAASGTPIVVTGSANLHPAVGAFLDRTRPADMVLLGGAGALSDTVLNEARRYGATRRVAGAARDATAAQIATQLWGPLRPTGVLLVNGYADLGWAYALAGAVTAARSGAVELYVQPDSVPPATAGYLESNAYDLVIAAGPATLVSNQVYDQVVSGKSGGSSPSPSPSPEPSPPSSTCVEDSVVHYDTDDGPWNAAQEIGYVLVELVEENSVCRVAITQRWEGVNGDGRPFMSYSAFWLDTDGDDSNGCEGGEVAVFMLNDGRYGVYDVTDCDSNNWTDSALAVDASLSQAGPTIRFDVDDVPANLRFTTEFADERQLLDFAPSDSAGKPVQTPVFG